MERFEFTRNYTDHSTDRGFQFEFHFDRCGSALQPGARFCPECGIPASG